MGSNMSWYKRMWALDRRGDEFFGSVLSRSGLDVMDQDSMREAVGMVYGVALFNNSRFYGHPVFFE